MNITGTLVNYYIHCKRQCYLMGNKINLEDNSQNVMIGKALHKEKLENDLNSEISIENIRLDKLTKDYLIEIKKSDADEEACRWQVIFYLKALKDKGIIRKGKIQFIEKNKNSHTEIIELTEDIENQLEQLLMSIQLLIKSTDIPPILHQPTCKKCAYYEYCYI